VAALEPLRVERHAGSASAGRRCRRPVGKPPSRGLPRAVRVEEAEATAIRSGGGPAMESAASRGDRPPRAGPASGLREDDRVARREREPPRSRWPRTHAVESSRGGGRFAGRGIGRPGHVRRPRPPPRPELRARGASARAGRPGRAR
jgi:hypothetical protein